MLATKGCTLLVLVSLMTVMISSVYLTNPIQAQPSANVKQLTSAPSEVLVTLFGINKTTGTIITFVTVKNGSQNVTKDLVDDALTLDQKDGRIDGIVEMFFTFENATINLGSEVKACTIVIKDLSAVCGTSRKIPDPRTDIQLDLHSAAKPNK